MKKRFVIVNKSDLKKTKTFRSAKEAAFHLIGRRESNHIVIIDEENSSEIVKNYPKEFSKLVAYFEDLLGKDE